MKRKPNGARATKTKHARNPAFVRWVDGFDTLRAVAELLDFSVQNVNNLHKGHTRPSLERALAIETKSGGKVPASSWGAA